MFGGNNGPFNMPVVPAGYGNGNGIGDDWIALIILAAIFGWGGFGYGGLGGFGGGNAGGVTEGYVLASDFANIERKIDTVNGGLCDGFYAQNTNMLNGFSGVQNTLTQGFAGINTALMQQGYESRIATQGVGNQLATCCCDIRQQIGDVNYNVANQAAGLGRQIERGFADTNYAMATQNCATLQAIDKVGDRVIDYLCNQETQKLRDENFALRLAASQEKQNNYLVEQLNPNKCPIPAYLTCNPNAPLNYNVTYGNGCGCA